MNLLIVVIENEEKVQDVLSVLLELDVGGLQVLESSAVMEVLAREAPIFAGLRELISRPTAASKLILGLTKRPDLLGKLDGLLRKVGVDLNETGVGYAVLLPVGECMGRLEFDDE